MNADDSLSQAGLLHDKDIPLFDVALNLALLRHPGRSGDAYINHLKKMISHVAERHAELVSAGSKDNQETRIAALKHVICDQFGYLGDKDNYDDLRNADMIEVIDRRKGLPIALSILAIECGRAQGWDIKGINFPGHFLIRFDEEGQRILSDPFNQFQIMQAADLRQLLKLSAGPKAELSTEFYQEISNREILLRLQNNIKFRQIESEDYAGALVTVRVMKKFAPREPRLLLDQSVLLARLGQVNGAIKAVEEYLDADISPQDRYDAEVLLRTLRLRTD